MKNLVFNLRTAKAQAEGCAKVTKSSRMAKILTTLTLLLTLGVGQMWANNGGFYGAYVDYTFGATSSTAGQEDDNDHTYGSKTIELGTLSSGSFSVTGVYLKCWDDWGSNYKSNGGLMGYNNKGGSNQELLGFSKTSKSGNNYQWQNTSPSLTLASYTDASGSYSFVCWFKTWWSGGDGNVYSGDHYYPTTSNSNYTFNYNIAPPAVSGFGVSASGFLAGSGTSEDPYLVASGSTLRLTASGSKAHNDANSSVNYKFGSAAYSTTATKNITVSSSGSIAVKARCINSSASLNGTETSTTTIYYAPVSIKDISVYIYVGDRTSAEINSVEMNGCTPYVGTKALSSVKINNQSAGAPKFTLSGNWLVYTFEDVTKVSNITCARSGGNIFTGEITDNVYYMYDGTALPGQCISRSNPTWGTTPASGAIGCSMTATVSGAPAGATITWTSTNTSAATVNSSGVISYEATGNTTIKANVSWSASGDYCAGSYELSQAISVTSGATVTATRTCPEYVAAGVAGQVSMHITFTGTSSGWKYRVKHNWDTGYETDWLDASGSSANWTMTGGIDPIARSFIVELYDHEYAPTPVATSSPISVTGENTQTVTIVAGANGTVSPSGEIRANNSHVHPTITATPNEHYHFVNWTSSYPSSAWVENTSNATTTVTATAPGYTITANFAGDQYTITYKDKNNAAYSGSNQASLPATHTYGTATALVNGVRSGYTFVGWYTNPECTGDAVTSIGATSQTGNFTLYAKWTAKTYDITYVDANNVATIADNPSTGSTDATINFTVTMKPGFKSLSVTAVDAGSNTVTVTNPSSNNYRFTMPASAVTVTVTATALPIVYVLKTKHANSSLGDGATGLPATGQIWAWKFSGGNNFYTAPGDFPGPLASSKATVITDDIIGDEWYRFIPDNTSYFDGSTAYHVILTSTNQILNTQTTFIENGSSRSAATHTGTIWIVPHGTDANTAYLYTSYPDEIVTPYNTTYYAGDHGSINVFGTTITSGNSQTIATTKNRTLTATPASGYEFNRWITTGSVTVADATSATTTVSATGAGGTVTATYFEAVNSGWYIKGHPAGDDWGTPTSLPLNRVLPGETNVYYRPVTLPANDQYFRFWCSTGGNHDYGASSNNLLVTKGTKYNLAYDRGDNFKYSAGGTVWFVVDASGATKKFWLQDPVEFYSVNFGYGDGCDEFTAKDGEDHDLVSGNTYIAGTALTFTQTEKAGYTFVEWNTAANGSGSKLGDDDTYSVASLSADVNVYAIYTENKTAITITTDGHGTITTPSPNSSPYSLGVTTGQAINASASTGYHWNTWTVSGTAALGTTATTASNTAKGNGTEGGTGTVTATFTPNTYRVQFHRNGGAGVVVYQDFTYDVAQNLTANSYTRTGYNFAGWALTTDGAVTYANGAEVSNLTTTNEGTFHLYAKWTPKQSALTFDYQTSVEGYGADGTLSSVYATYGAAMPALSGNMPTAANGYAFMGFYSETGGNGTKYYNADKSSAHNWDVDTESGTTLYAYYKKAEITAITFSTGYVIAPNTSTTVTATIDPTPEGTTSVCWTVLHSNDNPLETQPTFTPTSGSSVTFTTPETSTSYKIVATLRTGSVCGSGDIIDQDTVNFQVAGNHSVTVQYKCGSTTIKASTTMTGRPLDWSSAINPPVIFGYTFSSWTAGDGVTLTDNDGTTTKTSTTEATIKIKAIYDGSLTANYTQDNIIYFKNTLGWENVYVNLMSGSYWNSDKGSGNSNTYYSRNNQMSLVPGTTDIYSYNFGATSTSVYVSFTSKSQTSDNFWAANSDPVKVVYPTRPNNDGSEQTGYGFSVGTPMFVPTAGQTAVDKNIINGGRAKYYNKGYWRKYDPAEGQTGYTLKIYNQTEGSSSRKELKSIKFTDSDVNGQLFKAVANLEAGQGYGVKFMRDNNLMYTNITGDLKRTGYVVTAESHPDNYQAIWIKATAAGDYTFAITINGNGKLCIQADFPVAIGDYRVIYTDNDTWSQGTHTAQTWIHPSRIITQEADAIDTISFFVSKGHAPQFRIQQATAINETTGAVTWGTNVTDWTSCNDVTASGVYNFIFTQDGDGEISFTKKEAYTGNYYIRTDCSGASKWDNYRDNPDHLMTYSEYSIDHGGYSHYFCHWVEASDEVRRNLKFTIANDYSPCISDTLTRETASGTWANIDNFMYPDGRLKRNANVRFMWNQNTNMISRAYLDPAKGDDNFLVLASADSKIANESEVVQTSVVFSDNENWIYEANVKAKPGAQIKLVATWGDDPTIVQYFKGGAAPDATETLITGSTDEWYNIRLIYDFKTNRLIAAMLPSGNITNQEPINADVMFIREHQGDISQVTFTGSGELTEIKIAYGVMRFNKWTLNNKEKTGSHDPLDDPKSYYERALYFISFPFEVKLSEVFGFGTYAQDWIIEYYDGAARAATGWWEGQPGFWRYVWDRKNYVLQPNVGYLLELELGNFGTGSGFWNNDNERLELFFPSSGNLGSITNTTVNCSIPEHACTINRAATEGLPDTGDPRTSYNRTIFDSHWNVMPVPTYVNATPNAWNNTTWTAKIGPKFLYTWNMDDNTLTATSGAGYRYHAMHAYMVQYGGNVRWETSASPAAIVARNTYAEEPKEVEFRLEIQQNEKMIDQTFIALSNDETVSADFQFGEDMSKDFNARNANIFTKIGTTFAAGNTMPMTDQKTIVPVGVVVKKTGDYTFSIPDGTNGIGITLIDEETGIRTSLSALDYTVELAAGDYTERFWLEISPVKGAETGIDPGVDARENGVRKVMIDGLLYIIRDGKMYDARGARVE